MFVPISLRIEQVRFMFGLEIHLTRLPIFGKRQEPSIASLYQCFRLNYISRFAIQPRVINVGHKP